MHRQTFVRALAFVCGLMKDFDSIRIRTFLCVISPMITRSHCVRLLLFERKYLCFRFFCSLFRSVCVCVCENVTSASDVTDSRFLCFVRLLVAVGAPHENLTLIPGSEYTLILTATATMTRTTASTSCKITCY